MYILCLQCHKFDTWICLNDNWRAVDITLLHLALAIVLSMSSDCCWLYFGSSCEQMVSMTRLWLRLLCWLCWTSERRSDAHDTRKNISLRLDPSKVTRDQSRLIPCHVRYRRLSESFRLFRSRITVCCCLVVRNDALSNVSRYAAGWATASWSNGRRPQFALGIAVESVAVRPTFLPRLPVDVYGLDCKFQLMLAPISISLFAFVFCTWHFPCKIIVVLV